MTTIYLDARTITAAPSGVARYSRALIEALVEEAPEHDFAVIRHRSNQRPIFDEPRPNLREIPVNYPMDGMSNFLLGHRALQAACARGGPADLYHALFHILPRRIAPTLPGVPLVTTVHDFVWIDHPDASQPTFAKARSIEAFARMAIPFALRTSDRVIAISEPTRRRARDYIDDEKMVTISHGVAPRFFEPAQRPTGEFAQLCDGHRPCIIAVGNHKPYKNLGLLVEAFAALIADGVEAHLVLIGDCQRLAFSDAATDASEWITCTGTIGDDALRSLLGSASVFVLPSRVEGFGLPLLEAMATGLPTLIADVEPLRSIGGQATLRFPADDAEELAHLLRRVLEDRRLADRLRRRSLARAAEFRWEDTARRTLDVYDDLLARPEPSAVFDPADLGAG